MRAKVILIAFILGAALNACALGIGAKPTAVPTATAQPSPTPVPTAASPLAVLVLPADMDKAASDAYQKAVYDLAQASGIRFQVRNSFTSADIEPGLQIVIALPPDPGIASLAGAAPHVQFLAVNIPGISPAGNVSVLASGQQADIPAFIAGYTAAMISDDYRAGMILPKDDAAAQQAVAAFRNGMAYFCGLCNSFRLYGDQNGTAIRFPQFAEIPAEDIPGRLGGWANYMVSSLKVEALYVYPDPKIAVPQLYDSLGQAGAQIIGAAAPSPKPPGWVMEIGPDEIRAIQKAWPDLLAGHGGQSVPSPLGLADVDPGFLSPGKQRLVQRALDDLQAGRIWTGVNP